MKGKVTCPNCGWSWNKSESSVKDMHVCHNCGKSDVNMKNGGWLDNYNDSQASAPEGMEGDGYSNVGRDYSPAWGGQFQEGGEIPVAQKGKKVKYVESKNDPRYRAYQDSLVAYNNDINFNKEFVNYVKKHDYNIEENRQRLAKKYPYNKVKPISSLSLDKAPTLYTSPSGYKVKDMEQFKKPQQQVIVKKQEERKPIQEIENNLQPIGIQNDFNIEADVPQIRQQVRQPKYYDVEDYTQGSTSYNGNQTNYRTEDLSTLSEQSPNNTRKITPHYQMGGSIPGATGNMYARVGAPSNGPRRNQVDVTDASAQDGKKLNPFTYPHSDHSMRMNPFLIREPEQNIFIGGINPTYSTDDFSIGASMVGVGNEDFQKLPADYGIRGSYNPTDSLSINANISNNNVGAGLRYRFQNGGWLDQYDKAQEGKRVLPNNDRALQILANIQNRKQEKSTPSTEFSNVKIKKEQAVTKVDNTRTAPKLKVTDLNKLDVRNKTKAELAQQKRINDEAILADRKARMADAMKAQDEDVIGNPKWKEVLARETQSTGDKFRIFPNDPDSFIDDYLNPGVMIGDMAGSLGAAPYDMEQQESMMPLITAIGAPLLTGALEGLGARNNRQFINNIFNPVNMVPGYKSAEKYVGNKIGNQVSNITGAGLGYRDGGTIEEYPEAQIGALIKKGVKAVGNDAKLFKKAIKTSAKDYHSILKDLPKAKNLKEAAGRVAGLPIEGTLPRLSPEELKIFRQVQQIGRIRAEGKSISKQYQYALEQGLPEEHLKKVFGKTKAEIENAISNPSTSSINLQRPPRTTSSSDAAIDQMNASAAPIGSDQDIQINLRERMFNDLGLSPTSFITSAPVRQTDSSMFRIDPSVLAGLTNQVNPSKAQNFVEQAIAPIRNTSNAASNRLMNMVQDYPYHVGDVQQNVPYMTLENSGSLKNVANEVATKGTFGIQSGDVYTGSLNTSHSSYLPQLKEVFKSTEGAPQFFGYRPMNPMGFLSKYNYSQDDIAKYLNSEIDVQIKRGIIPSNVQRPYSKGNDVFLPHYGIKQFREGGIIDSDRGQWDYPGEVTRINSNEITMGPDPKTSKPLTKPLLGISDTGDVKLMRPGGNYKFDGKRVTEYPIAQGGLTMGTTSTENDVRESSAQSAIANTKAKKQAKLDEAKLLAEQEENRKNRFARDIKVRQPDGTIKIVNTGSPEYEKMYKAGDIQSSDAGEGDAPYFGGELPEVVLQQQMTPLLKAKIDYGHLSNKEAFTNRKKDEYIKSLGSQNWFGADRNNMPENVLRDINAEYKYNQNTRAIEDVAKAKGFDLNTRGNWIYNLTPSEKETLINSRYSGQLNPNEFSEMASGIQQLGNTALPGKPLNFDIPGLTQKELEEDRESMLSPLKTLAPLNMPGNLVANYLKNSEDYVDNPFLGGSRMGNVDVWDSMAFNPLSYAGVTGLTEGVLNLPNTISKGTGIVAENVNNIKKVIPNIKEAAKQLPKAIKNGELPETFYKALPDEFKQTPLGQDIQATLDQREMFKNMKKDINKTLDVEGREGIRYDFVQGPYDLESQVQNLDSNFTIAMRNVGGNDLVKKGISDLVEWQNKSPTFKRYQEIVFQNSPTTDTEMKAVLKEIADTMPKATDYAKDARKAITLKQKELLYNKKDVENLKAGIKSTGKNVIDKIKGKNTNVSEAAPVNYSAEEASTLDTIKELGKYRSLFNRDAALAKSHPETMENVNNLISKLDDDVVRNILGVDKQELINSYKSIASNVKQADANAAMAAKPIGVAELQTVNPNQSANTLRDLYLDKYDAPYSNNPSLVSKINKRKAVDKLEYKFEAPQSNPKELIHYVKTDYDLKPITDATGNVIDPNVLGLVSEGNAKGQIKKAFGIVNDALPGENVMGSESLSTDSYALTLDAAVPFVKKGRLEVKVDPNPQRTNPMGFATRFPGLALKDINSKIEAIEKASGVKIPRATFDTKYQEYDFPKIYFTKIKKNGGYIDKAKHGNQLVKLDQLTNFTNYNKPQPGGWLNKYN